jgi:hypothetical protein
MRTQCDEEAVRGNPAAINSIHSVNAGSVAIRSKSFANEEALNDCAKRRGTCI